MAARRFPAAPRNPVNLPSSKRDSVSLKNLRDLIREHEDQAYPWESDMRRNGRSTDKIDNAILKNIQKAYHDKDVAALDEIYDLIIGYIDQYAESGSLRDAFYANGLRNLQVYARQSFLERDRELKAHHKEMAEDLFYDLSGGRKL